MAERKVVDLKYKSKRIGEMNESELSTWGKALLMKIHVITGWTIPKISEYLNILIDQFEKYLSEKYPELNPDEIEYAFRSSGTTTEDWGKEMNLNLLDKILIKYINDRFRLSQDEEKLKMPALTQKIFTPEELENSAREDAERQYQNLLRGNGLFGEQANRPILVKDGLINEGESVLDFFKRKIAAGQTNIYIKR